jgi:murein DD-endopeptidase MepM/ murein hydrolase activator NlpD
MPARRLPAPSPHRVARAAGGLLALALLSSLGSAASAGVTSGPAGARVDGTALVRAVAGTTDEARAVDAIATTGGTATAGGIATADGIATASEAAYRLPLVGPPRVVRPFVRPATRYSAGHRGVDLATGPSGSVRAAGPGTIRFAGDVAGRGVVVIEHAGGISTEYEPLAIGRAAGGGPAGSRAGPGLAVRVGQRVAGGTVLGVVAGVHGECAPSACLHWGARRGGDYFDPLTLLQPLGPLRLAPTTSR